MLADITLSKEAWTAINSIAIAVGAFLTWLANRNRKNASAANSAAIAAVHEVAKSDAPPPAVMVNADKAVAAITKQP